MATSVCWREQAPKRALTIQELTGLTAWSDSSWPLIDASSLPSISSAAAGYCAGSDRNSWEFLRPDKLSAVSQSTPGVRSVAVPDRDWKRCRERENPASWRCQMRFHRIVTGLAALSLAACASRPPVAYASRSYTSIPSGALVVRDGVALGRTPMKLAHQGAADDLARPMVRSRRSAVPRTQ